MTMSTYDYFDTTPAQRRAYDQAALRHALSELAALHDGDLDAREFLERYDHEYGDPRISEALRYPAWDGRAPISALAYAVASWAVSRASADAVGEPWRSASLDAYLRRWLRSSEASNMGFFKGFIGATSDRLPHYRQLYPSELAVLRAIWPKD
jgi:hypothetical protein